jgi:hypothetical protein
MKMEQRFLGDWIHACRASLSIIERVQFSFLILSHQAEAKALVGYVALPGAEKTANLVVRQLLI